jgi:hypothetical protein
MNFFHHFYPSLLKVPGFLLEFITPIVKATKGTRVRFFVLSFVVSGLSFEVDDEKNSSSSKFSFLNSKKKQEFSFYTLPEYEAWREERGGAPGWKVKYYKGEFWSFSLFFSREERRASRQKGRREKTHSRTRNKISKNLKVSVPRPRRRPRPTSPASTATASASSGTTTRRTAARSSSPSPKRRSRSARRGWQRWSPGLSWTSRSRKSATRTLCTGSWCCSRGRTWSGECASVFFGEVGRERGEEVLRRREKKKKKTHPLCCCRGKTFFNVKTHLSAAPSPAWSTGSSRASERSSSALSSAI